MLHLVFQQIAQQHLTYCNVKLDVFMENGISNKHEARCYWISEDLEADTLLNPVFSTSLLLIATY